MLTRPQVLLFFSAALLCPVVWAASTIPMGTRLPNVPIIKFISYLVSHIFFTLLLSFTIVNPWRPLYKAIHLLPYWHEWTLLLWLVGLFISEVTSTQKRQGLGWVRTIVVVISCLAILTHCVSLFFAKNTRLILLYCRNQLLAISLLLCFVEFLNFLSFHHLFGPWAVIIRDLMKDLFRFLAILSLFLFGFSLHLSAVYQPVYAPPEDSNNTAALSGKWFQSPLNSFEMLFYALFGLVEPDYMPPMHLCPTFAPIIVKVVFGVYMMVTVVVLINLLIAMMSDTYQQIQAQSDTEWKFGRANLIRNMTTSQSTAAASPWNLIVVLVDKCQKLIKKIPSESRWPVQSTWI